MRGPHPASAHASFPPRTTLLPALALPCAHPRALSRPHAPSPPPPSSVNTNGSIIQDEEAGEVIQLQGDQRQNTREWLLAQEVVPANEVDRVVIHGF